jgi:DNA-binding transcriptional regulator YdaS (Cro superfamily)
MGGMDSLNKAIELCGGSQAGFAKLITEHLQCDQEVEIDPVTPQQVWNWINRDKAVPVQFCQAIEDLCNGEVTRKDLRPEDWWLIWKDLADQETTLHNRRKTDRA